MLIVAAQIRFSSRMRPVRSAALPAGARPVGHRARNTSPLRPGAREEADLPEPARAECRTVPGCRTRTSRSRLAHDAEPIADQRTGDDGSVTQNSRSTRKPWPRASRPPAIAGARKRPEPIQDTPIQTIGDWMWTSRRKLNGDVVQGEPIEASLVVVRVRHDRAGGDLQQQDERDDQEVLADLALAGRQSAEPASTGSLGCIIRRG